MRIAAIFALTVFLLIAFLAIGSLTTDYKQQFENFMGSPDSSSSSSSGQKGSSATDCRCLPGFIPSNTKINKYGGEFLKYEGTVVFVPDGNKGIKNWVPRCSMCNIDICAIAKEASTEEWYKSRFDATFTCDMVKKIKSKTPRFFCQNLVDPLKTRQCY